jgi:mannose-6-phosphate isomerase-like protein (cupin superfamily)
MPILKNCSDVTPDENAARRVWRMITPSTTGISLGAMAGVAAYKPLGPADGRDGRVLSHGHERPNFFYVISGRGIAQEGADRFEVKAGDVFVIRAAMEHAVWSTTNEPLVAFFLAMNDSM